MVLTASAGNTSTSASPMISSVTKIVQPTGKIVENWIVLRKFWMNFVFRVNDQKNLLLAN